MPFASWFRNANGRGIKGFFGAATAGGNSALKFGLTFQDQNKTGPLRVIHLHESIFLDIARTGLWIESQRNLSLPSRRDHPIEVGDRCPSTRSNGFDFHLGLTTVHHFEIVSQVDFSLNLTKIVGCLGNLDAGSLDPAGGCPFANKSLDLGGRREHAHLCLLPGTLRFLRPFAKHPPRCGNDTPRRCGHAGTACGQTAP